MPDRLNWEQSYPADKWKENKEHNPLESDLSGGWSYPLFEEPGPEKLCSSTITSRTVSS